MNFFSIKFKLLLVSALIIILISSLSFFHFIPKLESHEKEESVDYQRQIAQQLANNINNRFQNITNEIEAIAKLPEIKSLQHEKLDQVLSNLEQVTQFFNYYFVLDPQGNWLSYPSKPHLRGKKIKNDYWIQDVLENNATIFIDIHKALSINTIVSGFATPIRSKNGEIIAILRGVITVSDENQLLRHVKDYKIGVNGNVMLVDSRGRILADSDAKSFQTYKIGANDKVMLVDSRGRILNDTDAKSFQTTLDLLDAKHLPPVARVINGETGVIEYVQEQQPLLAAYNPISATGWGLIVQKPISDFKANTRDEITEFIYFLGMALILSCLCLSSFLYFTIRPLNTLLKKIEFKKPIALTEFPRDEIGSLAKNFKRYSEGLEEEIAYQTEELRNTNKNLVSTIDQLQKTEKEKKSLQEQILQAQKLESIGVLAGGIAHDFNNLLTGIMGYADLALTKIDLDNSARKHIEKQRQACERASELTRQLLSFSRKQIVDLKPTKINTVVSNLLDMASKIIGETIALEIRLEPEVNNILADKTKIEQVLMNLIVNARDAMPQGGKLTINTANVFFDKEYEIRHAEIKQGEYAMISVSDNGVGMSKEVQEKIFDPFFTTKEVGKGTGLGMATVYGIVKQHDGYIWVYSEQGQGTTFKIYFPVIHSEEELKREDEKKDIDLRGREKVLVVDDNDVVREFINESLQLHGYQVTVESLPINALEKLKESKEKYDLLLTDVVMPDMNGLELSKAVRSIIPSIKIIYMSGYQDKIVSLEDVKKEPTSDYIAKPVITDDLLRIMRQLLD